MTKRDDKHLVDDILVACADIKSFLSGCSKDQFLSDRILRCSNPSIPFKNIIGMRNILIHVYHEMDLDLVWETAVVFVPKLESEMKRIRKSLA